MVVKNKKETSFVEETYAKRPPFAAVFMLAIILILIHKIVDTVSLLTSGLAYHKLFLTPFVVSSCILAGGFFSCKNILIVLVFFKKINRHGVITKTKNPQQNLDAVGVFRDFG